MVGTTKMWQKFKENWLALLIAACVLLVSNWILLTQPMFYTHDFLHGVRVAEYTRGLLEGQWPVIWSQNFGFGFGMPLFEFYAPLPYLVGSVFYLIGFNLVWVTKLLFIICNILTFFGAYLWAREFYKPTLAVFSGALLTLASYRAMDIFARGALSEVWAIMALPWVFFGLTRIMKKGKNGILWTIFGGVILVLSHNISTMLVAPILLLYVILFFFLSPKSDTKILASKKKTFFNKLKLFKIDERLKCLLQAGILTFGLTAFYLLPAFFEKNLTQINTWILGDYFNFRLHFLYIRQLLTDNFGYGGSGWGPDDGLSFFLGWTQLIVLLISLGMLILIWLKNKKIKKLFTQEIQNANTGAKVKISITWLVLLVLLGLTLLLTTLKAQPIWELLEGLLAFTQFPWRYLGVGIVLLALVAPFGLSFLQEKWQKILIIILTLILLITSAHYFQGDNYLEEPSYYRGDEEFVATQMSSVLVDYLPISFQNEWGALPEEIKVLNLEKQPKVVLERMSEKIYFFDLEESQLVEFKIANYPNWSAQIDGETAKVVMSELGNVSVQIPAGKSQVSLKLLPTTLRLVSNIISGVTIVVVIGLFLFPLVKKAKGK